MKKAIKDLLGSKKFLVTLATVVVWVGGKAGLDLSTETAMGIMVPLMWYVLGQGLADFGTGKKETPKLEAGNDSPDE